MSSTLLYVERNRGQRRCIAFFSTAVCVLCIRVSVISVFRLFLAVWKAGSSPPSRALCLSEKREEVICEENVSVRIVYMYLSGAAERLCCVC